MKTGIDISKHQGTVDWKKVTADFVIIRAGWSWFEGGMDFDEKFLANVAGVQEAEIPWGVYIYAYDKTPAAAKVSANKLADLLGKYKIPYPVVYDFEDVRYLAMSKADNTAICKEFLETLQKRGYYAMLYTYTNFARGFLNMEELSAYDFWVADYTGQVGWTGPYGMWQYSGSGTAPGITGPVDLNRAYKDYPSIIQAAGLNGYGKDTGGGGLTVGADGPDSQGEIAALREEIATLKAQNGELTKKSIDLQNKIAAAKKALE